MRNVGRHMDHFLKRMVILPIPLLVVFWTFLTLPIVSMTYLPGPGALLEQEGFWIAALAAIGCWGLPLIIAVAASTRDFSVVPLFLVECVILLVQNVLNIHHLTLEAQNFRYFLLLGALTWFALVFLTKDSLYPLLAGNSRPWRLAPRLYASVPLEIWHPDDRSKHISVMLDNCSVTGMGMILEREKFEQFFGPKETLGAFILYMGHGDASWMLSTKIIRMEERDGKIFLGVEVFNTSAMRSFINALFIQMPAPSRGGGLGRLQIRGGAQQLAIVLWGISLYWYFIIPSLA